MYLHILQLYAKSYNEKVQYRTSSFQRRIDEDESLKNYNKQKKYCNRHYKKEQEKSLNKVNLCFTKDYILFLKTIKSFLSNKGNCGTNIKLVEKDKAMQDDQKLAKERTTF